MSARDLEIPVFLAAPQPPADRALGGGGLEGASRLSREMALWMPDHRPADRIINWDKELLDARSRGMTRDDGHTASAATQTQDSIVGSQFTLNSRPDIIALSGMAEPGAEWEAWEEQFQALAESRFNALAESEMKWLDAMRVKTFTDIIRGAVIDYVTSGEVLGVSEWLTAGNRPCKTAFNRIASDRLCNPNDSEDTANIRRGVVRGQFGDPQAYWFRTAHKYDMYYNSPINEWKRVDAYLPWGRPQVLHVYDQRDADQSRGTAAMVACLKEMKMSGKYRDVVLQNAVTNAMYAAAIESELPSDVVFQSLGGQTQLAESALGGYLAGMSAYAKAGNNMTLDGVKIPHLFPGTKLNFHPAGQIGDTKFEQGLMRHMASAFGLSYEEFSRDFTNTNYSSARASMMLSWRHMNSKKRKAADSTANFLYGNWLEEMINADELPLAPGHTKADFYRPGMREAYARATWIGAARGQIDEGKETDAAIARLKSGLSSWEDEIAKLGGDWRKLLRQIARERALMKKLGLEDIVAAMLKGGTLPGPGRPSNAPPPQDPAAA